METEQFKEFYLKLLAAQKDCPAEFEDFMNEHFEELFA